jgi:glycosyltransferase involved in cell wall biosynthesis
MEARLPKITVIIAAWRPEGLLSSVKDLDNQIYKDFEVIIVNDNRPEIRDIIPDILKTRENYHFIDFHTRTNYYGAISRNCGAQMAFTYVAERNRDVAREMLCFHDDDNEWTPDFLDRMVKLYQYNPECLMFGVDIEIRGKVDKSYSEIRHNELRANHTDLGAWMYHRATFWECGGFVCSPDKKVTFDWDLIKKMSEKVGAEKVCFDRGTPPFIFYHKKV